MDSAATLATASWPLFAVLAAWFGSAQMVLAGHYKTPGHLLMFWRSLVCICLCLPFVLTQPWPTDPRFFIYVFVAGTVSVITGTMMYNAAGRFGSAVVSRLLPMSILVGFVGWLAYYPARFSHLLAEPWHALGITIALVGCSLSVSRMRHCAITRPALIYFLPIGLLQGFNAVFQKSSQLHASLTIGPALYVMLTGCVTLGWSIFYGALREKGDVRIIFTPAIIIPGLWLGVLYGLYLLSQTTSSFLTPNPGYMLALSMSTPIWVHLYHRVRKLPIEGDVKAGLAFAGFATLLLILTTN